MRIALPVVAGIIITAAAAQAQSVFSSEIREVTFANGMRAVVARTPAVPGRDPRVFVGLYLRYGVAAAGRPELAHLVEHIAANNAPTLVNYVIPANLKSFGGNAMTRPDYMSFWRTVSPDALPAIIPNRANRVAGVRDDSAVFAQQVPRVVSETQRAIDRIAKTGLKGSDVLPGAFFGHRVPLAALSDSIQGYARPAVFAQINSYFVPGNAVLVVAGDLDVDATLAIVRQHLGAFAARRGRGPTRGPDFVRYAKPLVLHDAKAAMARLGIGLEAPKRSSGDYLAFLILDQLLLGGRHVDSDSTDVQRSIGSPLGRRLAAAFGSTEIDDGRYYSTDPPPLAVQSPSYLAAYVDVNRPMATDEIAPTAMRALTQTINEDLSDESINSAKRDLVSFLDGWLMSRDLIHLGDHLAAFALFDGRATRLNSLATEISAITPSRVREFARRYLRPGPVRIAVVVPTAK